MHTLIEQLFQPSECARLRELWRAGNAERVLIGQVVGRRFLQTERSVVAIENLTDLLMILCSSSTFAHGIDECLVVAQLVVQGLRDRDVFPAVAVDHGMTLARKTLVALAFFRPAMEARTQRRGAPSTTFYRNLSCSILKQSNYPHVAANHHRWEAFLQEMLL